MKAAVCHEFGAPFVIEELSIADPRANEIQVKIAACAICHSDIHYAEGAWGGTLPAVYGHEAAGIVTKIGPSTTVAKPGDAVLVTLVRSCGQCFYCRKGEPARCEGSFRLDSETPLHRPDGTPIIHGLGTSGFAEYALVHESQIVKLPDDIDLNSASVLACGVITGLGAVVNTAEMPYGSSAVIIGTGGVGLNAVQGARLSGASPLIALDILDDKLSAARDFGATDTVNSKTEDAVARVLELTNGRGADFVFVTVGVGPVVEQALGMLRKGGTLVLVGMPASGVMAAIEIANFAFYEHKVIGSRMGSANLQVDIPKLVELYEQGRLKLDELVTKTYKLEDINEAIAAVNRGEALRNVIVFD